MSLLSGTGGLAAGLWETALSALQVASIVVAGSFAAGAIATGTLKGGLVGAFSALMSFGAGAWFSGWGQIVAQAVSGGITELLSGGHFGNGFMAAGLTAVLMPGLGKIKSAYGRAAAGALLGGAISEATGGKFANGAISGAVQGAMMGGDDRESEINEGYRNPDNVGKYVPAESREVYVDGMAKILGLNPDGVTYQNSQPNGHPDARMATNIRGVLQSTRQLSIIMDISIS